MAQRLDQLDKRETELLEELDKQREVIKRLKEDRAHYRKKCDEKELVIIIYATFSLCFLYFFLFVNNFIRALYSIVLYCKRSDQGFIPIDICVGVIFHDAVVPWTYVPDVTSSDEAN